MLYCPNPDCQAANLENHQFCHKCATPLPHRYLWGLGSAAYHSGEMVAERYLCKQPRIFLDTKPGLLSNTYREPRANLLPYLRLTSYPLHVPELYDWISAGSVDLVLLDRAPLYWTNSSSPEAASGADEAIVTRLLPRLVDQWPQVSPFRQLNWFWQVATLWQPFSSESVAATLLDSEQLRVEGTLLRLLELQLESEQPSLADLGQVWLPLAQQAQPEVTEFLIKLCHGLIQGEIYNTELLLGYLDAALAQLSQVQMRSVQLATLTDQGPTRFRNEDACYPPSGTQTAATDQALLIVCDGIGGHQGGDVASGLAITTLEEQLKGLDLDQLDSTMLAIELEKAICLANDQISQRNDSEQRFDRQRMGTTVVMALVRGHELYLAHVGDSRAYWISRYGCHQITLDDDVASREVRLGYNFYRQALHQPSAGSLVQALGMGTSTMLYPTVQRLIPDEDMLFLLCSDGLSDNDQVEAAWTEILPLLDGKTDLAAMSQRLIEIGNLRNGYDNVTVGLMHYRVGSVQPLPILTDLPPLQLTASKPTALPETQLTELASVTPSSVAPSTVIASQPATRSPLLPFLLGVGVVGLIGTIAVLLPTLQAKLRQTDSLPSESTTTPSAIVPGITVPVPSATPDTIAPVSPTSLSTLEAGTLVQLSPAADGSLQLISRPPKESSSSTPAPDSSLVAVGAIPAGSVLEVLRKQNNQQENWVQLRICSIAPSPAPTPTATPPLQTGQTGWIREAEILPRLTLKTNISSEQRQGCL